MRFLLECADAASLDDLVAAGEAAHREGLDGVLLVATEVLPAPLVAAAALAARVPDIRLAVEETLGDRHPLELAEETAVVDVASGGRALLVVRPAVGREAVFGEALDLLRHCFAAAPFRVEGPEWHVPANLEQNVHNLERRVRMTPAPVQPRLELWTSGAGRSEGARRGLGHLLGPHEEWVADDEPASLGAPRARRERWPQPPLGPGEPNPFVLNARFRGCGKVPLSKGLGVARVPLVKGVLVCLWFDQGWPELAPELVRSRGARVDGAMG